MELPKPLKTQPCRTSGVKTLVWFSSALEMCRSSLLKARLHFFNSVFSGENKVESPMTPPIRSCTLTVLQITVIRMSFQRKFGSYAECGRQKQVTKRKHPLMTSQALSTLQTTSTKVQSSTSTLIHSLTQIGLMSGVSVTSSPSEDAHISCISTQSTQSENRT
jgi:hypothetical protein